jgi:hypothetical protein
MMRIIMIATLLNLLPLRMALLSSPLLSSPPASLHRLSTELGYGC